jgi:hypothetical protein
MEATGKGARLSAEVMKKAVPRDGLKAARLRFGSGFFRCVRAFGL